MNDADRLVTLQRSDQCIREEPMSRYGVFQRFFVVVGRRHQDSSCSADGLKRRLRIPRSRTVFQDTRRGTPTEATIKEAYDCLGLAFTESTRQVGHSQSSARQV
jgi:hypothetical protein